MGPRSQTSAQDNRAWRYGRKVSALIASVALTFVGLLFVTFLIGQLGLSGLGVALGVLLLALIKGQLVGAYFMGLGSLRGFWRWPPPGATSSSTWAGSSAIAISATSCGTPRASS